MTDTYDRPALLLSLLRGLLSEVHPSLRQASVEADPEAKIVRVLFEYDGSPSPMALESGSCVAGQVLGDFPADWDVDERHVAVAYPNELSGLTHIGYRRWEPVDAA